MIPIVTPEEMSAIDAEASEPATELIARAGAALARAAISMLGGTYGRVVNVIAGGGNNGADGRVAASRLRERGVVVRELEATTCPEVLAPSDLVIDAAFGTGFRPSRPSRDGRTWSAPDVGGAPVLAVDIPSGVDALTGAAPGRVLPATLTITFAALKPGLLLGPGKHLAGVVEVVDIGLDASGARAHLVGVDDVRKWWRPRPFDAHKWTRAVRLVAGSAGMTGAAALASGAAMRAGAGIVWLSAPGVEHVPGAMLEVVIKLVPEQSWSEAVLDPDNVDRFGALVIGPGLGRSVEIRRDVRAVVAGAPMPLVIDGDGLAAMSPVADTVDLLRARTGGTILTPHDGELRSLTGDHGPEDRLAAARSLAETTGAVVLLKGPSTVVADRSGAVRVIANGDERLATAGSGDVLSGVIGALIASGLDVFDAASAGAWIHADAAARVPRAGLVATDLVEALPVAFADLVVERRCGSDPGRPDSGMRARTTRSGGAAGW